MPYSCYEEFPPTYTMLHCATCPPSGGGDTAFANMFAAYDKLSPAMKGFLGGKNAVNRRPPYAYKRNDAGRPSSNAHPLVRTHPLTGWNGRSRISTRTPMVRRMIGRVAFLRSGIGLVGSRRWASKASLSVNQRKTISIEGN